MEVAMSLPIELPKQKNDHGMCFANGFCCSLNSRDRKIVCVTSGNSYFGSHLIKKLLACGYLVRVTIQNQANIEDMKELMREEMEQLESVVVARMGDLESLCSAFRGCHAIFHTSSFIDPHGISGYTERTAFLETEAAKNVIEACGRAAYIKRCIFTSSLLACIWKGNDLPNLIDESCWSDEAFCRENKLWLALAKTRAEKAAWSKATEMKVKLVSLCPGLLMAPSFPNAHLETSIPYLKGNVSIKTNLLLTPIKLEIGIKKLWLNERKTTSKDTYEVCCRICKTGEEPLLSNDNCFFPSLRCKTPISNCFFLFNLKYKSRFYCHRAQKEVAEGGLNLTFIYIWEPVIAGLKICKHKSFIPMNKPVDPKIKWQYGNSRWLGHEHAWSPLLEWNIRQSRTSYGLRTHFN